MLQPEPQTHSTDAGSSPVAVRLVALLPDILESVPVEERQLAERTLVVPRVLACDEDLADPMSTQVSDAFDFLVAHGVVLKQTTLAGRAALELLGPGDVLAAQLTPARQLESRAVSRYLAHGRVSLGALDGHFRLAVRRWPAIADFLHDRLGRQTDRASMHLAMLHLPRVEDRVTALFADLAERFGHMTAEGILIDLPLTHALIGGLVAGRRSTVTLALNKLAADGLIERTNVSRWKVDASIVSV
jgi:CRP/FNR family transcriptional regulator, cyclic AMP receptor protein